MIEFFAGVVTCLVAIWAVYGFNHHATRAAATRKSAQSEATPAAREPKPMTDARWNTLSYRERATIWLREARERFGEVLNAERERLRGTADTDGWPKDRLREAEVSLNTLYDEEWNAEVEHARRLFGDEAVDNVLRYDL